MKLNQFLPFITFSLMLVLSFSSCQQNQEVESGSKTLSTIRNSELEEIQPHDLLNLLDNSCIPESINLGEGCNDVEYIDTFIVFLDEYPGCEFKILSSHFECIASTLMDYTMGDFQILEHNCDQFSKDLNDALNISTYAYANFREQFETAVYNELERQIIEAFVPKGSFTCLDGIFFNIIFQKASCYKTCIVNTSDTQVRYYKVACGSDCCERHTSVCRNDKGELVTDTYIVGTLLDVCSNPPIYEDNPLGVLCHNETECTFKCFQE